MPKPDVFFIVVDDRQAFYMPGQRITGMLEEQDVTSLLILYAGKIVIILSAQLEATAVRIILRGMAYAASIK